MTASEYVSRSARTSALDKPREAATGMERPATESAQRTIVATDLQGDATITPDLTVRHTDDKPGEF